MQTARRSPVARSPLASGIAAIGVAAIALAPVAPHAPTLPQRAVVSAAYVPVSLIEAIDRFAADGSLIITSSVEGAGYIVSHAVQDFGAAAVPFAQAFVGVPGAIEVALQGLGSLESAAAHAAQAAGTTFWLGLQAAIATGVHSTGVAVADVFTGGQHAWDVVTDADTLTIGTMWEASKDLYGGLSSALVQTASGAIAAGGTLVNAVLTTGEEIVQGAAATAKQAAQAFETAVGAAVHPTLVAANRALLAAMAATNIFGHNVAALVATEAQYVEHWAQDAAAIFGFPTSAHTTAATAALPTSPAATTRPTSAAGDSGAAPAIADSPRVAKRGTSARVSPDAASQTATQATTSIVTHDDGLAPKDRKAHRSANKAMSAAAGTRSHRGHPANH